jgi:hypothetical protein
VIPRVLAVIEKAYRGTVEEQYAHVVWLLWSLRRLGGTIAVLLRGNATLYARKDQRCPDLAVAGLAVPSPEYESTVDGLLSDGGAVYVLESDLERLRLEAGGLCTGVVAIRQADLPRLFLSYDTVWYL